MNRWVQRLWRQRTVVALLAAGMALRLLWLGDVPGGLNQDEASIGYDAWAILHHGIDRNGHSWPVHLVAWGSGQNALYAYLAMPFLAFFGLTVSSLRMLAGVLGVMALLLFYDLGRRADREMGWCALLLLVTSPWHILASRWALESNILPVVVLAAVCLFARSAPSRTACLPAGCVVLTLAVYAYGPAYLFAPLFLAGSLWVLWRERAFTAGQFGVSLLCAGLVALPMLGFLLNNALGSGDLQVGPFSLPKYPGPARYGSIFLPFAEGGLARTLDNARTVLALMFAGADDGMPANAIPGWGAHYVWLLPFGCWGLIHAASRQAGRIDRLFLVWLLCAGLTAVVTEANINRINLVWLPLLWMSARGFWCLTEHPRLVRAAAGLLLVSCLLFSVRLFGDWNRVMSSAFFAGFRESIEEALARAPAGAVIAVTDEANMPYITALFVSRPDPASYIRSADIPARDAPFQQVRAFGRFVFGLGDTPEKPDWRYWVAHRSELARFNPADFALSAHGEYAFVERRNSQTACELGVAAQRLSGQQDWGVLSEDGPVGEPGAGFSVGGRRFLRGLGVHGDSRWLIRSPKPMYAIRAQAGISDDSACSDGMRFVLEADGRAVFDSGQIRSGSLIDVSVALAGATELAFVTLAGPGNACDHGNWLAPVISLCARDAQMRSAGNPETR